MFAVHQSRTLPIPSANALGAIPKSPQTQRGGTRVPLAPSRSWAGAPCLLAPFPGPGLRRGKRSHRNEKPAHHSSKVAPALCTWRKPTHSNVDQHGQRRLTKKPGDTDAGKEPWDQGGRDWQEAAARQGRRGRWPPPEAGDRQRKRLLNENPILCSSFRMLASHFIPLLLLWAEH